MAKAKAKTAGRGKKTSALMTERGGFTIIEVVLVLAIAGLIFLMVFLALPAMQRAQRDQQRRQTVGRVTQAIQNYQTNNNGRLPVASSGAVTCQSKPEDNNGLIPLPDENNIACNFIRNYLNGTNSSKENEFADPDRVSMGLTIVKTGYKPETAETTPPNGPKEFDHIVYIYTQAVCGTTEGTIRGGQPRDYAVLYKLEGSGTICLP